MQHYDQVISGLLIFVASAIGHSLGLGLHD